MSTTFSGRGCENLTSILMFEILADSPCPAKNRSGDKLNAYNVYPPAQSACKIPLSSSCIPGFPVLRYNDINSRAVSAPAKCGVYGSLGVNWPLTFNPIDDIL